MELDREHRTPAQSQQRSEKARNMAKVRIRKMKQKHGGTETSVKLRSERLYEARTSTEFQLIEDFTANTPPSAGRREKSYTSAKQTSLCQLPFPRVEKHSLQ